MFKSAKFVAFILALALVVGACKGSGTTTGPSSDQVTIPPAMPSQAIVPAGTTTVTVSWIELKPTNPAIVGTNAQILAWTYTPPGQGGMKSFSYRLVCNSVTIDQRSGTANTEVGYSSGSYGWWPDTPGTCTYTATTAGSTRELTFSVVR